MRTPLRIGLAAALALTGLQATSAAAQDPLDFDLRTWSQEGPESRGDWQVSDDGTSVTQTLNDDPTFFVSPETLDAATVSGVFEVETTNDDDIIGFVFGWQGPNEGDEFTYDHIRFSWKQADQGGFGGCTSPAGFTLTRFDGTLTESPDEREDDDFRLTGSWCHEQVDDDDRIEVLATNWGSDLGWEDNTEYEFTLQYTPDRIGVLIDGELVIEADGTFQEGSFGFYNYSQPNVRYSGFRATEPPPEELEGETDERLDGDTRFETTIEISRDQWEDGEADAVVLARSDDFADALAGTPFAVTQNGPLLITQREFLTPAVATEIQRLLGDGDRSQKKIWLLGGPVALDPQVENESIALGYDVERLQGQDRFETAIVIAEELPRVTQFLITTGRNFPDALAAGPAAANVDAAVLLSNDDQPVASTTAYLNGQPDVPQFAIGGPAATAYPFATAVRGDSRVATAVAVAERFFDDPSLVGVARSDDFPDSLAGGAHIAVGLPELGRAGGPMLLTSRTTLSDEVADYLCANNDTLERAYVYGGPVAVSQDVADDAGDRIDGLGC